MPNLDTHALLALTHNPEGGIEYAAGEVFDDAVRMAGGVPNTNGSDRIFALGVRSNNALTDPAFDTQLLLRTAQLAMRDDLVEAEIPKQLHRLCIGPGSDILFSGVSQQMPGGNESYLQICELLLSDEGSTLIEQHTGLPKDSDISLSEIYETIRKIASVGIRHEYADPAFVIARLKARAARRPKLAFPADFDESRLIPIFAAQQGRLAQAGNDIFAGTLATIASRKGSQSLFEPSPLFPVVPNVAIMVNRVLDNPNSPYSELISQELAQVHPHTNSYKRSYAARDAAHFLVEHVGRVDLASPLLPTASGTIAFPQPLVGSLTHSGGYAAAAVASADTYLGLGIDMEVKPRNLERNKILTANEQRFSALDELSTRTVASIKEAVFKAVHPLIADAHPEKFWFKDAEVTAIDPICTYAVIRMADTEKGRAISELIGQRCITAHYLQTDTFSSSVCIVC